MILIRNFEAVHDLMNIKNENYTLMRQALIEKEQILQSILNQKGLIEIIVNEQLSIVNLSADAVKYGAVIFGNPLKIGSSLLLQISDEYDAKSMFKTIQEVRITKESHTVRLKIKGLNGNTIEKLFTISPILSDSCQVTGYTITTLIGCN